jgi:hypothetical protein
MVVLMLAKLLLNLLVSKVGALQYGLIVRLQGKQCLTVLWAGGAGRYLIQINLPLRIELHHIRPVVTGSGIHHLDGDFKRTLQASVDQIVHCAAALAFACACSAR